MEKNAVEINWFA